MSVNSLRHVTILRQIGRGALRLRCASQRKTIELPTQSVPTDNRHPGEDKAKAKVLDHAYVQSRGWKHYKLRGDRERAAHHSFGHGLDERRPI
jgi:hypothetical protein